MFSKVHKNFWPPLMSSEREFWQDIITPVLLLTSYAARCMGFLSIACMPPRMRKEAGLQ